MNFLSFPRFGCKNLKRFPLLLLISLICAATVFAQSSQLSLVDIITVLRSKKATQSEKNQLLTEGVRQRGVTFAINADLEKELRAAGADDGLVAAIREKSPVVKTSATPQPKPEPQPVATPKPPDFSFYQNRANANFVLGEYDAAIVDYNKAIELNPKEPTVYFSRALAFYNNKNFAPAIADFDKVIELAPTESAAYFKRGNALEKTGSFEKALGDYKKAVELDAENEPAKAALEKLQAALQTSAAAERKTTVVPTKKPENENKTVNQPIVPTMNSGEPINLGALNSYATRLVMPSFPPSERQRATQSLVTVEIVLDEEGRVESAKAISGAPVLRKAAEDAVRRSKFRPIVMNDKPVKAAGFINFNFKSN